MDSIPLAADFCWVCTRYHGDIHGLFCFACSLYHLRTDGTCDDEDFDWENSANHFKVCGGCRVSRICSERCLEIGWREGILKHICKLNHALLSKSMRKQLRRTRARLGARRSRKISMLQAMHCCWGMEQWWLEIPGYPEFNAFGFLDDVAEDDECTTFQNHFNGNALLLGNATSVVGDSRLPRVERFRFC